MGPIKKDQKSKVLKADDFKPVAPLSEKNVVSESITKSYFPVRKKILLLSILGSLVIVALIVLLVLNFQNEQRNNKLQRENVKVCSDNQLEWAGNLIRSQDAVGLAKVTSEIESNPKYIDDANCLYVTTSYYISITDLDESREQYGLLKDAYYDESGFSNHLGPFLKTLAQFEDDIEFIEKQTEEFAKNREYGPPVGDQ